jgi:hypothetical protein
VKPSRRATRQARRRGERVVCTVAELGARLTHEPIGARSVVALDALFALGVDVERHLRVGGADLAHDPLDLEAGGRASPAA